eukprot:scaffold926_cov113-Isochrysis_galbana.AAC.2
MAQASGVSIGKEKTWRAQGGRGRSVRAVWRQGRVSTAKVGASPPPPSAVAALRNQHFTAPHLHLRRFLRDDLQQRIQPAVVPAARALSAPL